MIYQTLAGTGFEMRRINHRKTPGAGPAGRRVRRFLMGCSGWPGSVCFAIGASCTRPPAHGAYRPDHRASGYRACPCSLIVPQDALHGQRITGAGRLDHRQGQQFPATESRLLHFGFLLSSSNRFRNSFKALVRCRWTALRDIPTSCRFHRLPAPTHNAGSKCLVPVPADLQRRRPPARPGYVRYSHRL